MADQDCPDLLAVFDRWRTTKPQHVVHTWLRSDGTASDEYTLQALWESAGVIASKLQTVDAETAEARRCYNVAVLCYPPGLDFLVAFYGCLFAGVAAAPCYPPDPRNREARTARHFQSIVSASGASIVLTTAAYLRGRTLLREDTLGVRWLATDNITGPPLPPVRPPLSLAFLQYTSGSTSTPKGVMIGRSNLAHNLRVITKALASDEDTVCVSWLPQYHDMGLVGSLLGTLYCGGTGYHSSPLDFVRDPVTWLRNLSDRRATHTQAPSFAFGLAARKFLSSPCQIKVDLSCLVHATNGAEPIRASDVDAFCSAFASHGLREDAVVATYGLAEHTVFVCRATAPKRREFDSASLACDKIVPGKGTVLFGCGRCDAIELAIVRDRKRVSTGVGEIWVRSQSRARGYWRSVESSAETFGGWLEGDNPVAIDEDGSVAPQGWLRTGDLGFIDEEGDLFVCGRSKDLLIIRGKNHYPQDLEATWERAARATFRPGCSAVVSLGKDRVQIVCEARKNCPDLADACAVARNAVQRAHGISIGKATVVAQRELIKTSSGKIARRACRDALAQNAFTVLHTSEVNEKNKCEKALSPEERSQLRAKLDASSDDDVLQTCQAIASKVAKVDRVEGSLTQLGLGSMEGLHLCTELENAYGVALDPELLTDDELTLQALVSVLRRGGQAGPRTEVADGARLASSRRDALRQTTDLRRVASRKRDRVDGAVIARASLVDGSLQVPKRDRTATSLKAEAPLALSLPMLSLLVMVLVKPLLALLVCLFLIIGLYHKREDVRRKMRDVWWTHVSTIHEESCTRLVIEDPASLRQQEPCLVLIRDSVNSPWSHLSLCALHEDLFDIVPDGVVVPAPHGIYQYQTLLFFRTAFSRRRGTLDAVAADLFAGRAASIIVQASDLPSLSAIAASTGCRVVCAATLATPNGLVHALGAPCTGRTPKALKEALDAAEALARKCS